MTTNGDARQDDGIGTNPDVVANDDRLRADTLLVDALGAVFEVMVEGCHCDALCQIDVVADTDRTNDCAVDADAGMVANGDVAHSIVDAAERLDDATLAQPETAIGWRIHAHAPIDFRPAATMLVERCQQADVPSGARIALGHDEVVKESLDVWT